MLPSDLSATVAHAITEDLGRGDLTAALVPPEIITHATVITRENAVVCGEPWFQEVFRQIDPHVTVEWLVAEGEEVYPGQTLCRVVGPARSLLTGERAALNFLQTLSATATKSRRFAAALAGMHTRILDTRKTLPGLRTAQKYAVRIGGCFNHRHGLDDGILLKENHLAALGSIPAAVNAARKHIPPGMRVEIEVETLDQVRIALDCGVDLLLLDNFSLEMLAEAVNYCRGRALTEASGNITLATIRAIAATGVDFISCGTLTKDIQAIDLSLRFFVYE